MSLITIQSNSAIFWKPKIEEELPNELDLAREYLNSYPRLKLVAFFVRGQMQYMHLNLIEDIKKIVWFQCTSTRVHESAVHGEFSKSTQLEPV